MEHLPPVNLGRLVFTEDAMAIGGGALALIILIIILVLIF